MYAAALALLLFCGAASAMFGAASVSFADTVKILMSRVPLVGPMISLEGVTGPSVTIVLLVRLPRVVMAMAAGSALSVSGAAYQGMFRNSMADPYVLGISSGASAGAAIGAVLNAHLSQYVNLVPLLAFAGAIVATLLVYNFGRVGSKVPVTTLLLSGIAVSFIMSSVMTLAMVLNRDQANRIIFWTLGSFTAASWKNLYIVLPVCMIGVIIVMFFSRDLDAMMSGDDAARTLGVEVERLKKILLGVTSLMVAIVVSSCGVIGFVGLVIPHISRLLIGPAHRRLLPLSALLGALFLLLCDLAARMIMPPAEIPIGVITALCGSPFFIYLLQKAKRR